MERVYKLNCTVSQNSTGNPRFKSWRIERIILQDHAVSLGHGNPPYIWWNHARNLGWKSWTQLPVGKGQIDIYIYIYTYDICISVWSCLFGTSASFLTVKFLWIFQLYFMKESFLDSYYVPGPLSSLSKKKTVYIYTYWRHLQISPLKKNYRWGFYYPGV